MQNKKKKLRPVPMRFPVVRAVSVCFFIVMVIAVFEVNFRPAGSSGLALYEAEHRNLTASVPQEPALGEYLADAMNLMATMGMSEVVPGGQSPEDESAFLASLLKQEDMAEIASLLGAPRQHSPDDGRGAADKWNLFSYSREELSIHGVHPEEAEAGTLAGTDLADS